MTIYGQRFGTSRYQPERSVIFSPTRTHSGNVVLRVGREQPGGSWQKTEHVVLTAEEARELAEAITRAAQVPAL